MGSCLTRSDELIQFDSILIVVLWQAWQAGNQRKRSNAKNRNADRKWSIICIQKLKPNGAGVCKILEKLRRSS